MFDVEFAIYLLPWEYIYTNEYNSYLLRSKQAPASHGLPMDKHEVFYSCEFDTACSGFDNIDFKNEQNVQGIRFMTLNNEIH